MPFDDVPMLPSRRLAVELELRLSTSAGRLSGSLATHRRKVPVRRICCVCGRLIRIELWESALPTPHPPTHGLCPGDSECRRKLIAS